MDKTVKSLEDVKLPEVDWSKVFGREVTVRELERELIGEVPGELRFNVLYNVEEEGKAPYGIERRIILGFGRESSHVGKGGHEFTTEAEGSCRIISDSYS